MCQMVKKIQGLKMSWKLFKLRKANNQIILELIRRKKQQELESKSVEELEALLK